MTAATLAASCTIRVVRVFTGKQKVVTIAAHVITKCHEIMTEGKDNNHPARQHRAKKEKDMERISIIYSNGKGRLGRRFAFIRPTGNCRNKSRRCHVHDIQKVVDKYFPVVNYYSIDGLIFGAKDERFALREYWKVCEIQNKGKQFEVKLTQPEL